MIAPIQQSEEPVPSPSLRWARRLVASTLLKPHPRPPRSAPPVTAWKAWLFAVWVVVVAAVYFGCMAELF